LEVVADFGERKGVGECGGDLRQRVGGELATDLDGARFLVDDEFEGG
jgi:hypothetical protein